MLQNETYKTLNSHLTMHSGFAISGIHSFAAKKCLFYISRETFPYNTSDNFKTHWQIKLIIYMTLLPWSSWKKILISWLRANRRKTTNKLSGCISHFMMFISASLVMLWWTWITLHLFKFISSSRFQHSSQDWKLIMTSVQNWPMTASCQLPWLF